MRYCPPKLFPILILFFHFFIATTHAQTDWRDQVPEKLKQWIPWVLKEHKAGEKCVVANQQPNLEVCTWYPTLEITLNQQGLSFLQRVRLERPDVVELSYAENIWPENVKADDKKIAVVVQNKKPVVYLESGEHTINGTLSWSKPPRYIKLPEFVGAIKINSSRALPQAELDAKNNLWLRTKEAAKSEQPVQDFINYQIFRKIEDSIPVGLQTVVKLNVGGRARDITLPDILLGSTPYLIDSGLAVRIDQDKRLWVRVLPGNWQIKIHSILPAPYTQLGPNSNSASLTKQEVWSFESFPELRSINLSGAERVDPLQVNVPNEWSSLPAFVMTLDSILSASDEKRADVKSQANRFAMQRTLQLHSQGNEFSVTDRINGIAHADGRLNVEPGYNLGSVSINGQDQAVTQIDEGPVGVEIRAGNLNIQADGRVKNTGKQLTINGWLSEMHGVNIELWLPAGWSLLHAKNADTVSSSWVEQWNLLQIFLVLLASILAFKIISPISGLITGFTLLVLEHSFALSAILIFILVVNVLLKYASGNSFGAVLKLIKNIVVVGLVIAFLIFAIERVRLAVYPQLAPSSFISHSGSYGFSGRAEIAYDVGSEMMPQAAEMMTTDLADKLPAALPRSKSISSVVSAYQNYLVDSNNIPQTGFGKVELKGKKYSLQWSGVVSDTEYFKLYLLAPWQNLLLAILQVLLGAWVIYTLAIKNLKSEVVSSFSSAATILLTVLLFSSSYNNAYAEDKNYPSPQLLEELKEYALKNQQPVRLCDPNCARVAKIHAQIESDQLSILVEAHAVAPVAIGLLTNIQQIVFTDAVYKDSQEKLYSTRIKDVYYVALKEGINLIEFKAQITAQSASLKFYTEPGFVTVKADNWKVSGLNDNQAHELAFEKIADKKDNSDSQIDTTDSGQVRSVFLQPRVNLTRQIDMGVEWLVHSTLELVAASNSTVEIQIPLLLGESVTSQAHIIGGNTIQLTVPPGQKSVSWNSVLAIKDELTLTTSSALNIAEIWRVQLSNLWHAEFSGTPRINSVDNQNLQVAQWLPRAGEELLIKIKKPEAVPGPNKTINLAKATYNVAAKSVDANLELNIKSSLGQAYELELPKGARVKSVNHAGQDITSYSVENNIIRVDLNPGHQQLFINWSIAQQENIKFKPPQIDLKTAAVNLSTTVNLANNRWLLWASGPQQGPALLFWGLLPILILGAYAVYKSALTPLSFLSAFLLMLGLSFQPLSRVLIVFGFLMALGWRGRKDLNPNKRFISNSSQLSLGIWCVVAVLSLLGAIESGLLGSPHMRVEGNNSYAFNLNWYQDVSSGLLPDINIISLPIFYYRVFILAWALWLAFSIIKWSVWGWTNYVRGGGWVPAPARVARPAKPVSPWGKAKTSDGKDQENLQATDINKESE